MVTANGVLESASDGVSCADHGEDCRKSRCCKNEGTTCYEKDEGWASCLGHCTQGMVLEFDKPPFDTEWNCKELKKDAKDGEKEKAAEKVEKEDEKEDA